MKSSQCDLIELTRSLERNSMFNIMIYGSNQLNSELEQKIFARISKALYRREFGTGKITFIYSNPQFYKIAVQPPLPMEIYEQVVAPFIRVVADNSDNAHTIVDILSNLRLEPITGLGLHFDFEIQIIEKFVTFKKPSMA